MGGILTFEGGFPFSMGCQTGSYQNTDGPCRPDATGISPVLSNPNPKAGINPAAFVNRQTSCYTAWVLTGSAMRDETT